MSAPADGNTLNTDFDLMRSVAGTTDARNEEIRTIITGPLMCCSFTSDFGEATAPIVCSVLVMLW